MPFLNRLTGSSPSLSLLVITLKFLMNSHGIWLSHYDHKYNQ